MKPKKGVMPPALKRYWANKRKLFAGRTVKSSRPKSRRQLAAVDRYLRKNVEYVPGLGHRRKNPKRGRLMFRFEIQKGASKLFLRRDHKTFAKTGPFALFATASHMQSVANSLARKFPMLQGWKFYATPTHTYV